MKKIILAALMLAGAYSANAQVDFGADLVSSYVWRGGQLSGAAIQPAVSYTAGDLEIGAWASYALNQDMTPEVDLYASYAVGGVTATVTHYSENTAPYYRSEGLEASLGGEIAGIGLSGNYMIDSGAMYFEAGFGLGGFDVALGAGDGGTEDGEFGVHNVSLGYSKDKAFGQLVYNPDADQLSLVFGLNL